MMNEYFSMLKENLTDKKLSAMDPELVKKIVFKYVDTYGYVKGSYGYHNNNGTTYRGSPTVAEICEILDSGDFSGYQDVDISEMNSWMKELQPEEGQWKEFQEKIKETWLKNSFVRADLSLLCAAVNSFKRQKEYDARQAAMKKREIQHQAEVDSSSNRWAGEVGQEVTFRVKEAKIATYIQPAYYNAPSYPLWKIIDTDGLTYSWGDTSRDVEIRPGDEIKAKIRKLNAYKGIKETHIWKVQVSKGIAPVEKKPWFVR